MTKEKAIEIATKYISDRKRTCDRILEETTYTVNEEVLYGKFKDEIRDLWNVTYIVEGYDGPIFFFISIDSNTEEVLYTMTPSGYAEDWEEDITEK
jgi:hypothetical protein